MDEPGWLPFYSAALEIEQLFGLAKLKHKGNFGKHVPIKG